MKGILHSRLLKRAVHTISLKRPSRSLHRQRRLHHRIKAALVQNKISAGLPKVEKQPLEEVHSIQSVCIEKESAEDASIHEEGKQVEVKRENGLNSEVRNQAEMIEKSLITNHEVSFKGPIIPAQWEAAVQSIVSSSAPTVFICGAKNAGKSTFARYLVNSLLKRYSKVGYLDTDVGQPELTPPGCLSLHMLDKPILGLSALEMKDPERCYFYGDISPKCDPKFYLQSIFSLYDYFRVEYNNKDMEHQVKELKEMHTPLVINTHGWIQGVGFDVLVEILRYTMPTHVVQILLRTSSKNLPGGRFWDLEHNSMFKFELLYIDSVVGGSSHLAEIKLNARELRDLRIAIYFQQCVEDTLMQTTKLTRFYSKAALDLVSRKPYEVPISAIKAIHLFYQVPACESLYSLNAAIVGLGVGSTPENHSNTQAKYQPLCIGLGIIRAVDIRKHLFYVITPLPLEKLQQVDTFLHGKMALPIPLLKAPGYVSPYLCSRSISIEGTGSAVMGSGKKKFLRS